ncbi:MAG: hypothetical protein J3K34DRAFT_425421 [Monoraphidium minutum]|nr:MAG: hypothetical protein J3K34DRAFT_425421 [Monoraphidium minutum]
MRLLQQPQLLTLLLRQPLELVHARPRRRQLRHARARLLQRRLRCLALVLSRVLRRGRRGPGRLGRLVGRCRAHERLGGPRLGRRGTAVCVVLRRSIGVDGRRWWHL